MRATLRRLTVTLAEFHSKEGENLIGPVQAQLRFSVNPSLQEITDIPGCDHLSGYHLPSNQCVIIEAIAAVSRR